MQKRSFFLCADLQCGTHLRDGGDQYALCGFAVSDSLKRRSMQEIIFSLCGLRRPASLSAGNDGGLATRAIGPSVPHWLTLGTMLRVDG